jgi:hypothetical protein
VKLAPANQTFIPASNPGRQSFAVGSPNDASEQLGQALRTAVSGAQLRSVTIVAARAGALRGGVAEPGAGQPDDNVVVVQAQYAPDLDAQALPAQYQPRLIPRQPAGSGRGSSYLSPIEQYAQTQSVGPSSRPLLDVRA